MVYLEGIDISQWNGNIDLTPYRNGFVIIRAAYGRTADPKAQRNMIECERLGIPYGVYVYSYALDTIAAKMEADHVLQQIRGRKISLGVWFDMEDADGYKRKHGLTSPVIISNMCRTFCNRIKEAGYFAGIYASRSWIGTKIVVAEYPKWVADWGINDGKRRTDTSALGPMQQYTSKPLDKNVIYKPLEYFGGKSDSGGVLTIDGWWGAKTTRAAQKVFCTPVDGIVSRQNKKNITHLPAATSGWQWQTADFGSGSPLIRAVQKRVGAWVDGVMGPATATKMQSYFGLKVSGKLDSQTVKAFQSYINKKGGAGK